jgi:flagellar biosynthesis chaperone FliJ
VYVDPQLVDTGATKQFVTPQAGQSFQVGMSPAEVLANQRGQQGLNLRQEANDLTRQKLNFKQGQQTGDGYSNKPLPAAALKIQDEALSAYGAAGNIQASLDSKLKQIEDGKLKFGPLSNVTNKGLNAAGLSNEESRNYASFMSDLERLRNESLRLNTGVQTDGDAQRAWNELFQNINDTDLVKQRIQEIKSINARGSELQRLRIDGVRSNYNVAPYDLSQYDNMAPPAPAQPGGNLTNTENPPANPQRTVSRTGMMNGRKVVQYSDGSVEYGD